MVRDVFKKQYLNSYDIFNSRIWEGRSLGFKLKFLISNYPELALCTFGFFVLFPAMLTYKHFTFNEEKSLALRKYKNYYAVVRHDDPDIENIRKEKECGREYFPQ